MVNSQSNVVVSYDISTEKTLTIKEDNGTHMIYVKNLTAYCTTDYGISVDVNRKSASANAYFTHYSYISGNVTPGAATWYVNGKKVSLSTGSFNDSVTHGTYHLKVTSPGYKTYYDDVTMGTNTTMNLNIHLKKISSSTGPNMNEIYCIIGGIGGLGVILAIILIFRRR